GLIGGLGMDGELGDQPAAGEPQPAEAAGPGSELTGLPAAGQGPQLGVGGLLAVLPQAFGGEEGRAVLGGGDRSDRGGPAGQRHVPLTVDLDQRGAIGGALRVGPGDRGQDPTALGGLQPGQPGRVQQGLDALACHDQSSCHPCRGEGAGFGQTGRMRSPRSRHPAPRLRDFAPRGPTTPRLVASRPAAPRLRDFAPRTAADRVDSDSPGIPCRSSPLERTVKDLFSTIAESSTDLEGTSSMHRMFAAPLEAAPVGISWDGSVQVLGRLGAGVLDFGGHMGPYAPIAVAGTVVWLVWLIRALLSWTVPPIESDFRTTTSVIVPSFHEDVDILMDCLRTWREQEPSEIIIVLDVADTDAHARITALGDSRIQPILFDHVGKRSALGVGIRAAQGEVLVLVDSDTRWTPGLL